MTGTASHCTASTKAVQANSSQAGSGWAKPSRIQLFKNHKTGEPELLLSRLLCHPKSTKTNQQQLLQAPISSNNICIYYYFPTAPSQPPPLLFLHHHLLYATAAISMVQSAKQCLPLADSFLVLMIFAAYSWPVDFLTHRRTTEKAPLQQRDQEEHAGQHLSIHPSILNMVSIEFTIHFWSAVRGSRTRSEATRTQHTNCIWGGNQIHTLLATR